MIIMRPTYYIVNEYGYLVARTSIPLENQIIYENDDKENEDKEKYED